MKTATCKAKGLRLQKWVADKIIKCGKKLTSKDVKSTPAGVPGVDVQLSEAAFKQFPFAIECKNKERLNVWEAWQQTKAEAREGHPLLIIKRNRQEPLVVVDAEWFIKQWTKNAK